MLKEKRVHSHRCWVADLVSAVPGPSGSSSTVDMSMYLLPLAMPDLFVHQVVWPNSQTKHGAEFLCICKLFSCLFNDRDISVRLSEGSYKLGYKPPPRNSGKWGSPTRKKMDPPGRFVFYTDSHSQKWHQASVM